MVLSVGEGRMMTIMLCAGGRGRVVHYYSSDWLMQSALFTLGMDVAFLANQPPQDPIPLSPCELPKGGMLPLTTLHPATCLQARRFSRMSSSPVARAL